MYTVLRIGQIEKNLRLTDACRKFFLDIKAKTTFLSNPDEFLCPVEIMESYAQMREVWI